MTHSIKQFLKLFTGLLICSLGIVWSVHSMVEQWNSTKDTHHELLANKSSSKSDAEQQRATVSFSRKVIENRIDKRKRMQS